MFKESVLLIDDDKLILKALKTALSRDNIDAIAIEDSEEALSLLSTTTFDVIVLDLIMPKVDGFELITKIRNKNIFTPIIVLSGKEDEHNKILALGLGADDYLTKPFSISLLISKIKAFYRRSNKYSTTSDNISSDLSAGPFSISLRTLEVFKNNDKISLTAKELSLLKFFIENPNQVFTKEQIYQNVWNENVVDDNTIMVYMKRLRNKIEADPKKPEFLKTIWGIGYKFQP